MTRQRFLRSDWMRLSRLGKNRRKKQKWRRARGRHNKLRNKRFGYPVMPTVGYASPKSESGLIQGLKPVLVHNLAELSTLDKKKNIAILARVGAKKKLELMKKANESGIKIYNINKEKKQNGSV
jgi:large subunit ribosomal protein L32e